jgi:hypothetical protein
MRRHADKIAIDLGTRISGVAIRMRQPKGALVTKTIDARLLRTAKYRPPWRITLDELTAYFRLEPRLVLVEMARSDRADSVSLMEGLREEALKAAVPIQFVHARTWSKRLFGSANANDDVRLAWLEKELPKHYPNVDTEELLADASEHELDALGVLLYESQLDKLLGRRNSGPTGSHRIACISTPRLVHPADAELSPRTMKHILEEADGLHERRRRAVALFWTLYWAVLYNLKPGVPSIARAAGCARPSLLRYLAILERAGLIKTSRECPNNFPKTIYLTFEIREARREAVAEWPMREWWLVPAKRKKKRRSK